MLESVPGEQVHIAMHEKRRFQPTRMAPALPKQCSIPSAGCVLLVRVQSSSTANTAHRKQSGEMHTVPKK